MAALWSFAQTDIDYGHYLGKICHGFLLSSQLQIDFLASHGHTIFHDPERQLTSQIGKGACIAAEAGFPVISDFRSLDVALGGQGAPLVPIGDKLLFGDYDYCLNLGGFGNISFEEGYRQIAFDVCPVNIVLNHYARLCGHAYDADGKMASNSILHTELFAALNQLSLLSEASSQIPGKRVGSRRIFTHCRKIRYPC